MKYAVLLLVAFAAVAWARPQSDCEKHREGAEKIPTIMKLIPKCEENGDYSPLQCYENSKFCVCYDKKGHAASPISSSITQCACHLERKRKSDSNHDNAFIPQCNDDGSFSKKQCWDYNNSCWCVDDDGKQVGKIHSNGDALKC